MPGAQRPWTWSWFSRNLGGGEPGVPNYKSLITLLFLKSTTGTFSQLRPVNAGHSQKKKIPSFSHTSKADVTFFTRAETETPNTGHDGGGFTWLSQHRGLDDTRALNVLLALHHPQLQLGWGWASPFPQTWLQDKHTALTTGPGRGGGRVILELLSSFLCLWGEPPTLIPECPSQQGCICCSTMLPLPSPEGSGQGRQWEPRPARRCPTPCPPASACQAYLLHLMVRLQNVVHG